jgi:hypothetical protein
MMVITGEEATIAHQPGASRLRGGQVAPGRELFTDNP